MSVHSFRPMSDPGCFDPDRFASNGYPFELWERMRREAPVSWIELTPYEPFWAITRHADIKAIGKDSENFCNAQGISILRRDQRGVDAVSRLPLMLTMDPPEHQKNRMVLRERFKPSVMRALEEHIHQRSRLIVDEVAARRLKKADGKDVIDFVEEVAMRLPLDVILELLGVPVDDREQIYLWSNAVIGSEDPDYGDVALPREAIQSAQQEMFSYFGTFLAARRVSPRDDLVSLLVDARIDGAPLSDREILGYCFLLAIAGNETTRNATSGAMLALIEHPSAKDALISEPNLMTSAVEELLRWVTPIVYMARTAVRDVEIQGQLVRAGEKVALFYPSGNRDETVFEDANRLKLDRASNRHLTFGFGRHACLGNDLARIELRAILRQVLDRFPNIALAGPVQRLRSNFVGGIKRMPVALS